MARKFRGYILSSLLISGLIINNWVLAEQFENREQTLSSEDKMIQEVVLKSIEKNITLGKTFKINKVPVNFEFLNPNILIKNGAYVCSARFSGAGDFYDISYYLEKTKTGYEIVKKILEKKNDEEVKVTIWTK